MEQKNEMQFVGLKITTTVDKCGKVLPKLWEDFMAKVAEIKHKLNPEIVYGVCTSTCEEDCEFDYFAAVGVSDVNDQPEGFESVVVPPAKYEKYVHKGKVSQIGETYMKAQSEVAGKETGVWLERYDEKYIPESDDSEMEIWCAVKE